MLENIVRTYAFFRIGFHRGKTSQIRNARRHFGSFYFFILPFGFLFAEANDHLRWK